METIIGCNRKQRIGNPNKMATSKCWMPKDGGRPVRERWIGWNCMNP
jgi:hypothetical protein